MDYQIENNNGKVTVTLIGDITFSDNVAFRQMLKELSLETIETGAFELSKVDMVDSAALGMFLIAKEQANNAGWKMCLVGAQGHVLNMLKLTKLIDYLCS